MCNKADLLKVTERFLEAKIRNNVKDLHLSDKLQVTSNGDIVALGQGETWTPGITVVNRHTFVDPKTRSIIFFGTLAAKPSDEERTWWYYTVRLAVDHTGAISEIEELSNAQGFISASELPVPFMESPIFEQVLPEDERISESSLVQVADSYWDALTTGEHDGVPFSPDCQRSNLGTFSTNSPVTRNRWFAPDFVPEPTVGWSSRGYFNLPQAGYRMINRRYYIADVPRGIVVGVGVFKQSIEGGYPSFTLMEAFKIKCGHIAWIWGPTLSWDAEQSGWADWERPE